MRIRHSEIKTTADSQLKWPINMHGNVTCQAKLLQSLIVSSIFESWLNLLYQSLQLSVTLALPHVINVLVMSSDRRRFCSGTRHVYAGGSAMFSEWHPMDDRAWDLQDSWICRYSGGVQCPSSSESSKRHGYLFFEGILHTLGFIF